MIGPSPWPILAGGILLNLMLSFILFFKKQNMIGMMIWLSVLLYLMYIWWKDLSRESEIEGVQTLVVKSFLKMGFMIFIFSEIMFFFGFFWSFFHMSMSSTFYSDSWPPYGVVGISAFQVPLLNTVVLLSSGVSVTLAHHLLMLNKKSTEMFMFTVMLGLFFTMLQLMEYNSSYFSMSDSSFGSIFFMATGFHGLHVLIGSFFIVVVMSRDFFKKSLVNSHLSHEFSIWYWHFVDVVWLLLFSFIYWWGG